VRKRRNQEKEGWTNIDNAVDNEIRLREGVDAEGKNVVGENLPQHVVEDLTSRLVLGYGAMNEDLGDLPQVLSLRLGGFQGKVRLHAGEQLIRRVFTTERGARPLPGDPLVADELDKDERHVFGEDLSEVDPVQPGLQLLEGLDYHRLQVVAQLAVFSNVDVPVVDELVEAQLEQLAGLDIHPRRRGDLIPPPPPHLRRQARRAITATPTQGARDGRQQREGRDVTLADQENSRDKEEQANLGSNLEKGKDKRDRDQDQDQDSIKSAGLQNPLKIIFQVAPKGKNGGKSDWSFDMISKSGIQGDGTPSIKGENIYIFSASSVEFRPPIWGRRPRGRKSRDHNREFSQFQSSSLQKSQVNPPLKKVLPGDNDFNTGPLDPPGSRGKQERGSRRRRATPTAE